jgi:putative transposase
VSPLLNFKKLARKNQFFTSLIIGGKIMPRLPRRLFLDYSCYHVITRGNQKQNVFWEPADFLRYLGILKKAKHKYHVRIYGYCLMPNHVHLLIEVVSARSMSGFMSWLNRGYTAYFNTKYAKVGHLWQGRYKSKPIVKGHYLITCANYIEANPVRAKMALDINDYAWSSHRERCLLQKNHVLDEMSWNNEKLVGTLLKSEMGTP